MNCDFFGPERDDFSSDRYPAQTLCLSMILSENRFPGFEIMLSCPGEAHHFVLRRARGTPIATA
jgi:hypothetical protein